MGRLRNRASRPGFGGVAVTALQIARMVRAASRSPCGSAMSSQGFLAGEGFLSKENLSHGIVVSQDLLSQDLLSQDLLSKGFLVCSPLPNQFIARARAMARA